MSFTVQRSCADSARTLPRGCRSHPMSLEPLPNVLAIALDVAGRLERVHVRYVIGGSLASSVHGEPRATMDVDVVADLPLAAIAPFVATLRPDYYVDDDAARRAVMTG